MGESTVAIRIGYPKQRRFNVIAMYRQWSDIFDHKPFEKISFINQSERFKDQIERILTISNIETYLVGDLNIDYKIMKKNEDEKISYEKNFNPMLETIRANLIANNFVQLINENTRTNKILDHIYTNNVNKVISIAIEDSSTDHKYTSVNRSMKIDTIEEKFFLTRKWKDVDYDIINNNIINTENYINMLESKDINCVTNELINVIQSELNSIAPVQKIKVIQKSDKISTATKKLINEKNKLYKEMKKSDDPEIRREYKIMASRCCKAVTSDRNSDTKKLINENINNPKKLWKVAKDELYGTNSKQPERILENGRIIRGSKGVANALNRHFIQKVNKIKNEIPISNIDPMSFYTKHVPNLKNQFQFKPINMSQLRITMSKIRSTTSNDLFGISMNMIKNLKR